MLGKVIISAEKNKIGALSHTQKLIPGGLNEM